MRGVLLTTGLKVVWATRPLLDGIQQVPLAAAGWTFFSALQSIAFSLSVFSQCLPIVLCTHFARQGLSSDPVALHQDRLTERRVSVRSGCRQEVLASTCFDFEARRPAVGVVSGNQKVAVGLCCYLGALPLS